MRRVVIIEIEIFCPFCGTRHEDKMEWRNRAHRTHQCISCAAEFDVCVAGKPNSNSTIRSDIGL